LPGEFHKKFAGLRQLIGLTCEHLRSDADQNVARGEADQDQVAKSRESEACELICVFYGAALTSPSDSKCLEFNRRNTAGPETRAHADSVFRLFVGPLEAGDVGSARSWRVQCSCRCNLLTGHRHITRSEWPTSFTIQQHLVLSGTLYSDNRIERTIIAILDWLSRVSSTRTRFPGMGTTAIAAGPQAGHTSVAQPSHRSETEGEEESAGSTYQHSQDSTAWPCFGSPGR
jgi:hypothetical protein